MANDDDDDAMEKQKRFEKFMLGGEGRVVADAQNVRLPRRNSTDDRRYWQKVKAFQQTLQRDWLDVDDELEKLVVSVANLRHRLELEHRLLEKQENRWKQPKFGYRHDENELSLEDVQETLDYDLNRHEKLMAGGRALLASLSQAQDALGRRLEDLLVYTLTTQHEKTERIETKRDTSRLCNQLFTDLAMELLRKQLLFQELLDSCMGMLRNKEDSTESLDSGHVAESCARDWPRGSSSKSFVNDEILEKICNLGQA